MKKIYMFVIYIFIFFIGFSVVEAKDLQCTYINTRGSSSTNLFYIVFDETNIQKHIIFKNSEFSNYSGVISYKVIGGSLGKSEYSINFEGFPKKIIECPSKLYLSSNNVISYKNNGGTEFKFYESSSYELEWCSYSDKKNGEDFELLFYKDKVNVLVSDTSDYYPGRKVQFVYDKNKCPSEVYISNAVSYPGQPNEIAYFVGAEEDSNYVNRLSTARNKVSCGNVTDIPRKIPELTSMAMNIIQIAIPIILVLMGSIDLFKGITANKEDEMKKGQQMFIKRLLVAAVIFLVVIIVKFFISIVADANVSNIVDCIDCFVSNDCEGV